MAQPDTIPLVAEIIQAIRDSARDHKQQERRHREAAQSLMERAARLEERARALGLI